MTAAAVAREYRELVKDRSYRATPLGGEVGRFLRFKRGRLTPASYRDYESILARFSTFFADLELRDFEPPVGAERLVDFLEHHWGNQSPRTYRKALSVLSSFFRWASIAERIHGDPTLPIEAPKRREVEREVFSTDVELAVIAAQEDLRDRVGVALLFHTGIRKGALRVVQFKHFDHAARRLTVFTKGGKVRKVPIVDPGIWNDLERLILETEARPHHFLICRRKAIPRNFDPELGRRRMEIVLYPAKATSDHGLHNWWYRCLQRAGVVPTGITRGEKMHKVRHTAGQRLLDATHGNVKAVQRLLGHKSIQTTLDVYVDWDVDQLAESMTEALRAREQGEDK